ncbi:MAG: hypothetical protein MR799_08755 [Lachnospiraceae bacterium]|nr:hypothetical protein [Lachnospiraceae bacterium]
MKKVFLTMKKLHNKDKMQSKDWLKKHANSGTTMVEVIVAFLVVTIMLLIMMRLIKFSGTMVMEAKDIHNAQTKVQEKMYDSTDTGKPISYHVSLELIEKTAADPVDMAGTKVGPGGAIPSKTDDAANIPLKNAVLKTYSPDGEATRTTGEVGYSYRYRED